MGLGNPHWILPTARGASAFRYRDPEGAPDVDGFRYHAALDAFAPGGTIVRSPVDGQVVEVRASHGSSGQIFGGVVKVRDAWGRVFVMRHIDPGSVQPGVNVRAGDPLGRVTDWRSGSDHIHLEVWRSLAGGYYVPNMLDPGTLDWAPYGAPAPIPVPKLWPPPHGDTLRLVLGERSWAGWEKAAPAMRWVAAHGVDQAQARAAVSWKGETWRGPLAVTNVVRSLVHTWLD